MFLNFGHFSSSCSYKKSSVYEKIHQNRFSEIRYKTLEDHPNIFSKFKLFFSSKISVIINSPSDQRLSFIHFVYKFLFTLNGELFNFFGMLN